MKIKKMVYEKLNKKTNKKFEDSSDIFSIGIDSLDLIELVTEAEEELSIQISDEDLKNITKVGDIIFTFEKATK